MKITRKSNERKNRAAIPMNDNGKLVVIAVLIFFLSIGSASASGSGTFSISGSPVNIPSGHTAGFGINITNNWSPRSGAFEFNLNYDPAITIVVGCQTAMNMNGTFILNPAIGPGKFRVGWFDTGAGVPNGNDIPVISFVMQSLKSDGSVSPLEIEIIDSSDTNAISLLGSISTSNGSFSTRKDPIRGDLNNNRYVDMGDVTTVAYIAVHLVTMDLAADFNNDGNVDTGDASKIAWYYVGKELSL
jgi:hypothetical protein